jgi:hypothetical protein
LLFGSASPELAQLSAETLAGWVAYHKLSGFNLLSIGTQDALLVHPKCGASWEGFILREVIRCADAKRSEAFFWGVHAGAELDLLILKDERRLGFEIKLTKSPRVTASMRSAAEALELDHLYVMCHGAGAPWALAQGVTAVPAACLVSGQWLSTPLRNQNDADLKAG